MTINDDNWKFLHQETGLSMPFNDMYFRYLRDLGYTGTLQDMIAKSKLGLNPSTGVGALSTLFRNGENGFIFYPASPANLFQDIAATTPVLADGDPVGRFSDQGPNGRNATNATAANRPLYKIVDGVPHLLLDGVNDALGTTMVPTTAVTLAVAFRVATTASHTALGGGISTGNKRCYLATNNGQLTAGWGAETFGSATNSHGPNLVGLDAVGVLTGDATSRDLWLNGSLLDSRAPSGGPDGTGGGLTLGNYNNNGTPAASFSGREYAAFAIDRRVTPAEVKQITHWLRRSFFLSENAYSPSPAMSYPTVSGASLQMDGATWRGIGVNIFDLRTKTDIRGLFQELASYGVPFVRFNAGGYGAGDAASAAWRLYLSDEPSWWAILSNIFRIAQEEGVGLVPSMFWRPATIPDLMFYKHGKRDALDQWGVQASNTRAFMREYTTKFVNRFKDYGSLWAWEFGNEYFTYAERFDRRVTPTNEGATGGPTEYLAVVDPATANGASDIITSAAIKAAMSEWAQLVQSLDPSSGRMISTGNSIPGTNVANNYYQTDPGPGGNEGNPDDTAQWMTSSPTGQPWPLFQTPTEFNSVSAHIYQDARTPFWYFDDGTAEGLGVPGLIGLVQDISESAGKAFFLGEFGSAPGGTAVTTAEQAETYFYETLDGIVNAGVPMSAVWLYGAAASTGLSHYNINPGSGREYQLTAIQAANASLATA